MSDLGGHPRILQFVRLAHQLGETLPLAAVRLQPVLLVRVFGVTVEHELGEERGRHLEAGSHPEQDPDRLPGGETVQESAEDRECGSLSVVLVVL